MNIKSAVFVAYHKPSPVFESDVFHPIHVGASGSSTKLNAIRDDSGDNISVKNPYYCELTGLYWIWKNYLPAHPEIDRIGLCHYRRFLDPFRVQNSSGPFRPVPFPDFREVFKTWNAMELDQAFHHADVILPAAIDLRRSWLYDRRHETVYTQLVRRDHKAELDALLALLARQSDECRDAVRTVFSGHQFHNCLTFVMRADLFRVFSEWLFNLLSEMESHPETRVRSAFFKPRTAGFLAERLLDVWLTTQKNLLIRECDSVQLSETRISTWSRLRLVARHFRHPVSDARSFPLPGVLQTTS